MIEPENCVILVLVYWVVTSYGLVESEDQHRDLHSRESQKFQLDVLS
jgi:hypothetical protein